MVSRIAKRWMSTKGNVITLSSQAAYEEVVKSGQKSMVYFTASWCGPCKMISPVYQQLSVDHKDVQFFKVDVDELESVAAMANIRSMPTFHPYVNGQLKKELAFSGADANKLKQNAATLDSLDE